MEIISNRKKFVESEYAPENPNVYWVIKDGDNISEIREYVNGEWKNIIKSEGSGVQASTYEEVQAVIDNYIKSYKYNEDNVVEGFLPVFQDEELSASDNARSHQHIDLGNMNIEIAGMLRDYFHTVSYPQFNLLFCTIPITTHAYPSDEALSEENKKDYPAYVNSSRYIDGFHFAVNTHKVPVEKKHIKGFMIAHLENAQVDMTVEIPKSLALQIIAKYDNFQYE